MYYDKLTLMDVIKEEDYIPEKGELVSNGYIYFLGDGESKISELDNIFVVLTKEDSYRVSQYIAGKTDLADEYNKCRVSARIVNNYDIIPIKGELVYVDSSVYKVGDGIHKISELPEITLSSGKKGLGCLKSPYDSRDYQFSSLVTCLSFQKFPKEYTKTVEKITTIFDQMDTSMCCACATAMSRYIYEFNDSENRKLFSPLYIYGNRADSVVVNGIYEDEGMFLKDAIKQLCNYGCCYYDSLPGYGSYKLAKSNYEVKKDILDKEAYPFRTSSYYAVKTDREIMKAIIETGSVLASFIVTSGWYDVESDGIIPTYGNLEGGHAVLIVGWKIINDKRYWIILNSWGPEWGDHGFGYIESNEMMMEAYCILDEVHEIKLKNDPNEIHANRIYK